MTDRQEFDCLLSPSQPELRRSRPSRWTRTDAQVKCVPSTNPDRHHADF